MIQIPKRSYRSADCSVVQSQGVQHVYVAALPRAGTDLAEQLRDALATVRAVMDEGGTRGSIVRQAVFVSDVQHIGECRRLIEEFYGRQMPATTYVPQAPCQNKLVAIEAFGIGQSGEPVQIDRRSDQLVITRHNGVAWCHCSDVTTGNQNGSLHSGALAAFSRMAGMLEDAGFSFSQVVRTWLYLGDIVGSEGSRQRYQELNRARADFYADVPFPGNHAGTLGADHAFYPASTGIGARGNGLAMSCMALVSQRDDLLVTALENPNQISAPAYDSRYSPSSPRFSRAMAVVTDAAATVFVSGTASITEAQSRHADHLGRQTHQTLDNIEALIGPENFARHGIRGTGATLADLAHIRVYVKHAADYEKVLAICRRRVGQLPAVYAVADICRPELLVEIEGVAYAARSSVC